MKETLEILKAIANANEAGETVALATVVKISGSTYRRPGARMLIRFNGDMVGAVSGGCLEQDVAEHAKQVIETGVAKVIEYDTSWEGEIIMGMGLGCEGAVYILVERVQPDDAAGPYKVLQEVVRSQQSLVYATVMRSTVAEVQLGDHVACHSAHHVIGEVGDVLVQTQLVEIAQDLDHSIHSHPIMIESPSGVVDVLFEIVHPPFPLTVFGSGHDVRPLVEIAASLGRHITIVDRREAFADSSRFPLADQVIHADPQTLPENVHAKPRGAAVVMTHHYETDKAILAQLVHSPIGYIGMLGPRRRTERIIDELAEEGLTLSREQRNRVHAPVGLDLGAETPEEIALSILAEVLAVQSGHQGGFLSLRDGPIH